MLNMQHVSTDVQTVDSDEASMRDDVITEPHRLSFERNGSIWLHLCWFPSYLEPWKCGDVHIRFLMNNFSVQLKCRY